MVDKQDKVENLEKSRPCYSNLTKMKSLKLILPVAAFVFAAAGAFASKNDVVDFGWYDPAGPTGCSSLQTQDGCNSSTANTRCTVNVSGTATNAFFDDCQTALFRQVN